jgi:carbonic anhydrase/acetyltransferase-like protein (isoleucine patch superfamily)
MVIGAVTIGAHASIWPTAVLRADFGVIKIGSRTSIQDGTVLHTSRDWPTVIGADCVVGHNAHLEGAVIGDGCLIGSMSACLQRVKVGKGSLVGASALLTEGTEVPAFSRALGAPATIAPHDDREAFVKMLKEGVEEYVNNARRYQEDMAVVDLR